MTSSPQGLRGLQWIRFAILIAAISWGVVGAVSGVLQQRAGLDPQAIDCGYRVQLLRDRVVALMESSPAAVRRNRSDDQLSTLLRETQAACSAKDERLAQRIQEIRNQLREFQERARRDERARQELLAL